MKIKDIKTSKYKFSFRWYKNNIKFISISIVVVLKKTDCFGLKVEN